jgi:hypothetical protein
VSSKDEMFETTHSISSGPLSNSSAAAKRIARLADYAASLSPSIMLFERLHALSDRVRLLAAAHPRLGNTHDAQASPLTTRRLAGLAHDGSLVKLLRLAVARSTTMANAISGASLNTIVPVSSSLSASSVPQPSGTSNGIRQSAETRGKMASFRRICGKTRLHLSLAVNVYVDQINAAGRPENRRLKSSTASTLDIAVSRPRFAFNW